MGIKTSIKVKKFWYSDLAADGGCGTDWKEIEIGQREGTVQFNGSDADVTNYKNVIGDVLESAISKGSVTCNFQLADLSPVVIADFTGGVVIEDTESSTYEAPENPNQSIEKSIRILSNNGILIIIPRCSFDAYPMMNDDDLHYYQMNSTVVKPEKNGEKLFTMSVLKAVDACAIKTFALVGSSAPVTIVPLSKTIAIEVVLGTAVTALVPIIETSLGASIVPASGVAQDFTTPVTYTVKAVDGTTADWVVTVTVAS